MVACPRCNGQGNIYEGMVRNKIILYICDECDACWENKDKIEFNLFKDLSLYLEDKGIIYNQNDIQILRYI